MPYTNNNPAFNTICSTYEYTKDIIRSCFYFYKQYGKSAATIATIFNYSGAGIGKDNAWKLQAQ